MKSKTSRGIVTKLICCTALVVLTSAVAFSQAKSGALLTIDGTGASSAVHLKIYDSQIHTTTVRSPAGNNTCSALGGSDDMPTDAYVLQGGSPTGCDPGDAFETNFGAGVTGTAMIGGFTVNTLYTSAIGTCSHNNTICVGGSVPDTGFLTVSNSTGSSFTGTITLSGTSPIAGGFCPPLVGGVGVASDSVTFTTGSPLSSGGQVTLALSNDSSNCGGFNQSQTGTLLATGDSLTFLVGPDSYEIDGANNAGGESIKFSIVPVLQSSTTLPIGFHVGNVFPTDTCTPLASFSGPPPTNPVCVEVQLDCSGNADCSTFANEQAWHLATLFKDPLPGTPVYLKTDVACPPPNGFDQNIFLSYNPNVDPLPKGGTGGNSCFVFGTVLNTADTTFTVSVPGYASKFFAPVANPPVVNNVNAGNAIPFIWQEFDANTNTLVTNPTNFFTGGFCANQDLSTCPLNSVAVQFIQTPCPTGVETTVLTSAGSSGLKFDSQLNTFKISAKTLKNFAGKCAVGEVIVTGSVPGLQSTYTALFSFH